MLSIVAVLVAVSAEPAPCPSGQRCGDVCIAWTEVCGGVLAESIGLRPPEPVPGTPGVAPPGTTELTLPPSKVPPGSSLLSLPTLSDPGSPTMRREAPAYCRTGQSLDASLQFSCIPYYQLGPGQTAKAGAPALADCPQHRRCNGTCLDEGAVCPAPWSGASGSDRLSPYEEW